MRLPAPPCTATKQSIPKTIAPDSNRVEDIITDARI